MAGLRKETVERAVSSLNKKASQLGMDRQFGFIPGSARMGVSYVLEETSPVLGFPSHTKIGRTLQEAHQFVRGMNQALASMLLDRQQRRSEATGEIPRLERR